MTKSSLISYRRSKSGGPDARAKQTVSLTYLPLGAVVLLIAAYAALLGASWMRDRHVVLQEEFPAHGDYSRLTTSLPQQTIAPDADPAAATKQLQTLDCRAAAEGRKITVVGSAHFMGGHTLVDGGWRVEIRVPAFQHTAPVRIEHDLTKSFLSALPRRKMPS